MRGRVDTAIWIPGSSVVDGVREFGQHVSLWERASDTYRPLYCLDSPDVVPGSQAAVLIFRAYLYFRYRPNANTYAICAPLQCGSGVAVPWFLSNRPRCITELHARDAEWLNMHEKNCAKNRATVASHSSNSVSLCT